MSPVALLIVAVPLQRMKAVLETQPWPGVQAAGVHSVAGETGVQRVRTRLSGSKPWKVPVVPGPPELVRVPLRLLVVGSVSGTAKGSTEPVVGQAPLVPSILEYAPTICGANTLSKRCATAASITGRISTVVSASTWSLNGPTGSLLMNVRSACVALWQSR